MRLLRPMVALTLTAATFLSVAPAAHAAAPADRRIPGTASADTYARYFLTPAQVQKTLGLKNTLYGPPSSVAGTFNGANAYAVKGFSAAAESSSATYPGPYKGIASIIIVAPTDAATKTTWDTTRTWVVTTQNQGGASVIANTPTRIITYQPGGVGGDREATVYVNKAGLVTAGACSTTKPEVNQKVLTACATKVANAQWIKANKAMPRKK